MSVWLCMLARGERFFFAQGCAAHLDLRLQDLNLLAPSCSLAQLHSLVELPLQLLFAHPQGLDFIHKLNELPLAALKLY